MAIFVPRFVRQLRDVLLTAPADGEILTYDSADGKWKNEAGGGGGGPPTGAAGGVLGGTYPNPGFGVDMATQAELDAHVTDITDAHDATAVSIAPFGTIAATQVQAALEEIVAEAVTDLGPAVILDPQTSARNTIAGPGDVIRAIVKAHAAQSVDLTQWQISAGDVAVSIGPGGVLSLIQRDLAEDYAFEITIPDRDLLTGAGWFELFESNGGHIWGVDAWGGAYLYGPLASLTITNDPNDSATQILGLTNAGMTLFGSDADVMTLFTTSATSDEIGFFNALAGQQSAGSISDLWTAFKNYGLLDAGSVAPTIGGAPTTATYITQTADAGLSAEQALSLLATGLVKNTTGTGVLSIGAQGTDYYAPGGTDVAVADGGTGASTAAGARTALDVPSNAEAVLDAIVDAKGDLLAGTAADTVARLAVSTNGKALVAASGETTGLKWDYPPGYVIARAASTTDVVVTSTTEATPDLILSLGALTYEARPYVFEINVPSLTPTGTVATVVQFWDDVTLLFRIWQDNSVSSNKPLFMRFEHTPTAASHTFKIMCFRSGGTSVRFEADGTTGTGAWSPLQFRATVA